LSASHRPPSSVSPSSWPGNVRELRSLVRRAVSYDEGDAVDLSQYLAPEAPQNGGGSPSGISADGTYKDSKAVHDAAYFSALFEATGGNVSEMARRADVNRETVRAHIRHRGKDGGGRPRR
jgi:DNA-binding NtrC family response regulator